MGDKTIMNQIVLSKKIKRQKIILREETIQQSDKISPDSFG